MLYRGVSSISFSTSKRSRKRSVLDSRYRPHILHSLRRCSSLVVSTQNKGASPAGHTKPWVNYLVDLTRWDTRFSWLAETRFRDEASVILVLPEPLLLQRSWPFPQRAFGLPGYSTAR